MLTMIRVNYKLYIKIGTLSQHFRFNGELYQCYCRPSGGEEYCNLLSVNPAGRAASDHFLREMRC